MFLDSAFQRREPPERHEEGQKDSRLHPGRAWYSSKSSTALNVPTRVGRRRMGEKALVSAVSDRVRKRLGPKAPPVSSARGK